MNWDALGAVAELLGASGVIGSLVYLARQIRHSSEQTQLNTRAVAATSYNQAVSQLSAWGRTLISEAQVREFLWKALQDPSSVEGPDAILFGSLMGECFFSFENLFRLYEQGMIDEASWENSIENNLQIFRTPGAREFAANRKSDLARRFWSHIEARL